MTNRDALIHLVRVARPDQRIVPVASLRIFTRAVLLGVLNRVSDRQSHRPPDRAPILAWRPGLAAWILGAALHAHAQPTLPISTAPLPTPLPAAPPAAAAVPARGTVIIEITGLINQSLVPQVRSALRNVDPQRYPTGALFILDSNGGDGMAALEVGRMARAANAHAFVRGQCSSACVTVLAGSVVRAMAENARVGVHKGRITTIQAGVEVDAAGQMASDALRVFETLTLDFLRQAGMPELLYRRMQSVPHNQIHYLERAELRELGLLGFDPAYRRTRAPAGARVYSVGEEIFEERTLRAGNICARHDLKPVEILRCYSRVLRTGE